MKYQEYLLKVYSPRKQETVFVYQVSIFLIEETEWYGLSAEVQKLEQIKFKKKEIKYNASALYKVNESITIG